MTADLLRCDEAMHHLAVAIYNGNPALLSENTRRHLSECPLCRASILLMFRASAMAPPAQAISCDECLEDLPAFIDLKALNAAEAAQTYPGIWWHLWICPDCSETYALTQTLLDAQQPQKWVLHQPGSNRPCQWLNPICIPRNELDVLLPKSYPHFTPRGTDKRHLLFDGPVNDTGTYQCAIWATQTGPDDYQIDVESVAPLDCMVELRCGDIQLQTAFDTEGWARLGTVPVALLTDKNGPDLNLAFVAPASAN